jgi:hypothetical protein
MGFDVPGAEALYRQVAADPAATAKDRGRAETELARIAWLVDDKGAEAAARLARSLPANPEPCEAALLYGRVLNASGRAGDVPELVGRYIIPCASLQPAVAVEVARSRVLVAAVLPPGKRAAALAVARAQIRSMPEMAKASLGAGRAMLDVGLLAGDGREALAGWRDYLWLGDANKPRGFGGSEAAVTDAFVDGARNGSSTRDAVSLVALLVRAGFAEEAERFVADRHLAGNHDPRWRAIDAYLAMRTRLRATILAHDRAYARDHHENADAFEAQIIGMLRDGVRAAGAPAGDDPWPALETLWGLRGQTGVINGVSGLICGHAVEDDKRMVVQGNRQGAIRFIALDNMIENSFSAWLWDVGIGPGGWASGGDVIHQVRPLYAQGVLRALVVAIPGAARTRALADSAEMAASDARRIKGDDPVPLPGLGRRLALQAIDQVAAQVRAADPDPAHFAAGFRRRWWDLDIESSIILHEGRHVLDQIQYKGTAELSGPELEFRGKLSEIAYGALPRNALSGILGAELGLDTSHGAANARIMKAYREWVAAHDSAVAGFDPAVAPALQIDKLSDDQLRAIATSIDPAVQTKTSGT